MTSFPSVYLALIGLAASGGTACASDRPETRLAIDDVGARPVRLDAGGHELALTGEGGFSVYDATHRERVPLPRGRVTGSGDTFSFESLADGNLRVAARFEHADDHVVVRGEIENLRRDDRGFILDYRIPRLGADAIFSHHLEESVALDQSVATEVNAFPLAAMSIPDAGIALAIPPDEPRVFGLVGDERGMAIRFYLGTSPATRKFANRASFVFVVYAVDPAWRFRSALDRYYGFYPDYYQQRLKKEGLMMFQMTDRNPPNIGDYGFHLSETQWGRAKLHAAITRDERNGITTFPYMIVGQREIKFLPQLPRSYEAAMAAYEHWTVADQAAHPHTKENAAAQGDVHLKTEVDSSALHTADGGYSIVIRDTLWGGNSVTFKMNPNPDLFVDRGGTNVGRLALGAADRWLAKRPEYDGMFVDSLGANWPAALNYRRDHFAYARYPLTFDPEGKVALDNAISHYEYMETLREKMYATGRLTLGNGVYAYESRGAPEGEVAGVELQINNATTTAQEFYKAKVPAEHYRIGSKVSRFFCSALLDVASSEFGVGSTVEMHQDVRVMLGRKPYAFLNYHWEDGAAVAAFVNRSLGHGIFASSCTNWHTGEQYESSPNGYGRDRELLAWYGPLVRLLSAAGWEPVRHARIEGEDITCERFGRGDVVYFSLYNDAAEARRIGLYVDLEGLGFGGRPASFAEIARGSELYHERDGTLRLVLEPKQAYIVAVRRGPAI